MPRSTVRVKSAEHYSGMIELLELARNFYQDNEKYRDKSKQKQANKYIRVIKEQRAENNHANSFQLQLPIEISDFVEDFEPHIEFQATEVENKYPEEMGFIREALQVFKNIN